MVVFTCNACGDSVKKNQVETHVQRCQQCQCLSCMDCGKEFWGNDYESHTKCITEKEKYSGKDYKAKPSANKGEKMQEMWTDAIRNLVETAKVKDQVKKVLEKLLKYNNIPRKQPKFENFVRNCLHMKDPSIICKTWKIVSNAFSVSPKSAGGDKAADENHKPPQIVPPSNIPTEAEKDETKESSKQERKKNRKRKKSKIKKEDPAAVPVEDNQNVRATGESESTGNKEVRSKKSKKAELDQEISDSPDSGIENGSAKRERSKKTEQKMNRNDETSQSGENGIDDNNGDESGTVSRVDEVVQAKETKENKKKRHHSETMADNVENTVSGEEPDQKKVNVDEEFGTISSEKFCWGTIVRTVLEKANDNELSVKKLKKKVFAEYMTKSHAKLLTKELVEAKLMKKVQRNQTFRVHKDRVKLVK